MKHDCFLNRNPLNRRPNEFGFHDFPSDWEKIDAIMAKPEPAIIITQNGSRWMGEEPADLGQLLEVLRHYTLDPFWGDPIDDCAISCRTGKPLYPAGYVKFSGNFYTLSHGFDIITNDAGAIADLTAAIRANMATDAYAAAVIDRADQERERKARFACA